MPRALRRMTTVTLLVWAGMMAGAGSAVASTPIGSDQHFIGLVNGKHAAAVIYVVCPGPADGDETGPIAGGQTVAVRRMSSGGGDTGQGARVIFARITPTTIVSLNAYRHPQPIPTSGMVPCKGPGSVVFSSCPLPQPCGAGALTDTVAVTYIDIAA